MLVQNAYIWADANVVGHMSFEDNNVLDLGAAPRGSANLHQKLLRYSKPVEFKGLSVQSSSPALAVKLIPSSPTGGKAGGGSLLIEVSVNPKAPVRPIEAAITVTDRKTREKIVLLAHGQVTP